MCIAKRIPAEGEVLSGTWTEVAAKYGLTKAEFVASNLEWAENEGFDSSGNEYETLHDWLISDHNKKIFEPYQKSDDLNN